MHLFVDQLDLLNTQVRAITRRIRELLATHPDAALFLSFPGMGQITAATMLAEMGEDRGRFPTAGTLLAETGTAPVTRASGRSRTVRFRYAANKRMRHAIDWWAFVSVRENPWALASATNKPSPRPAAQPRPARTRRPLGPDLVALLDRQHPLRPCPAPERPPSRQPEPPNPSSRPPSRELAPACRKPSTSQARQHEPRLTAGAACVLRLLGPFLVVSVTSGRAPL